MHKTEPAVQVCFLCLEIKGAICFAMFRKIWHSGHRIFGNAMCSITFVKDHCPVSACARAGSFIFLLVFCRFERLLERCVRYDP